MASETCARGGPRKSYSELINAGTAMIIGACIINQDNPKASHKGES